MKLRYITSVMLAMGLMMTGGCIIVQIGGDSKHHEGKGSDKEEEDENEGKGAKDSKAKLQARAKISESKAREIAMGKVPNGTIKEGELEMENGKLQWSFDMSTPGSRDITEVNIDAITGKVLAVAKESPADQAKEKDDEAKEGKKEKD